MAQSKYSATSRSFYGFAQEELATLIAPFHSFRFETGKKKKKKNPTVKMLSSVVVNVYEAQKATVHHCSKTFRGYLQRLLQNKPIK